LVRYLPRNENFVPVKARSKKSEADTLMTLLEEVSRLLNLTREPFWLLAPDFWLLISRRFLAGYQGAKLLG